MLIRRFRPTWVGAASIIFLAALSPAFTLAQTSAVSLSETGSTLMAPLWAAWASRYEQANLGTRINTGGTNSGTGIGQAIGGSVEIGASDAYMSDDDIERHKHILNIPLGISAQIIAYNLPGLASPLRLSGPVLADIYSGRIRNWDAPPIAALNPGVSLPHQAIVPIRRKDASGDTFVFTQFLTFSAPAWEDGPGYGLDVDWPTSPGMRTAAGNTAMVATLARTGGGIAYVGGSYVDAVDRAGLGTAFLRNEAGHFVRPTAEAITEASDALTPRTPSDERLTLAFAPGDLSYPLVNYEYAVVRDVQKDKAVAAALRAFLLWTLGPTEGSDPGQLARLHFTALPTGVRALSEAQIARIR